MYIIYGVDRKGIDFIGNKHINSLTYSHTGTRLYISRPIKSHTFGVRHTGFISR